MSYQRQPEGAPVSPLAVGLLALWFGVTGFGGGFAVAQRIRRTVVGERGWISENEFVEHFAVASALPGTTATNLLTVLGLRVAGMRGATIAAVGFLLPSVALMICFGAAYERLRSIAAIATFLDGMSYATVGVVAAVAVDMRRQAIKTRTEWAIGLLAAAVLSFGALNLLEVIAMSGLFGVFALRPRPVVVPCLDAEEPRMTSFPPASSRMRVLALPLLATGSKAFALCVVFARIGVATFGGGFAMIPSIEHEVVGVRGWLNEPAFHDAMVLGQVTPGPVAIAATFIGYRVAGGTGAIAATLGMFGPAFALAVLAGRSLSEFRSNRFVRGFLQGVSPAVVGVIAAAAISLSRASIESPFAAAVALGALMVLAPRSRVSPLIPLALGGVATAVIAR